MDTHCVSRSLQLSTFLNKQQHCRYKKRCCHLQTLCGTCLGPESWLSLLSHLAYPEQLSTAKMRVYQVQAGVRASVLLHISNYFLFFTLPFATTCSWTCLLGKASIYSVMGLSAVNCSTTASVIVALSSRCLPTIACNTCGCKWTTYVLLMQDCFRLTHAAPPMSFNKGLLARMNIWPN